MCCHTTVFQHRSISTIIKVRICMHLCLFALMYVYVFMMYESMCSYVLCMHYVSHPMHNVIMHDMCMIHTYALYIRSTSCDLVCAWYPCTFVPLPESCPCASVVSYLVS